jgi:eukaryotic-like serine/threonine-protein kinase
VAKENIPETIGRYQIRHELGRGMMGVVYEAHDPSLKRPVALKVVRLLFAITDADKDTFERRFFSEARIAARLSHPGIVVVHDIGRDPETGILYIALERLQGRTLAAMTADETRLPWREAASITARMAEALGYAHAQGVVHRDIKPANVMVLPTGEPKIMDFGLAKHETGHDLTAAGQFVGTPLFMAPEQVTGGKIDGRTDLFSLGSVLYTLLTGTRAFAADSVHRIMTRVVHQEPRPATEVCPDLPRVFDDVLARAMAKDPAARYQTGDAMAADLDDVLAGRAPRHLAGWTRPPQAEGTMVAAREGEAGLKPLAEPPDLSLSLPPTPQNRRRSYALRTLALGLLLAGLSLYYFSSEWPDRFAEALAGFLPPAPDAGPEATPATESANASPPSPLLPGSAAGASTTASPSPTPGPMSGVDAAGHGARPTSEPPSEPASFESAPDAAPAAALPVAAPPVTPPAAAPTASPIPLGTPGPATAPGPAPALTAAPSPAPSTPAPKPGTLSVHMEHHVRGGTLKMWLDNRLVLEETLDAQVTRKVLFFPVRKGVVEELLKVSPGRHEVRVQVKWDENVELKRIAGSFRSGTARRLEVRISRLGGGLSLEWK